MLNSWNQVIETCIHGVKEELDYHDCPECKKLALEEGLRWYDKKETWIYTERYRRIRRVNENKE